MKQSISSRISKLCVVGAIMGTAWISVWWLLWYHPHDQFERLLAGDNTIKITSLNITGQGRHVVVEDDQSAEYFTVAFRSASRPHHGLGTTYTAVITLGFGTSVQTCLYVPTDAKGLTVAFPVDGFQDPVFYWVQLTEPMPESVTSILRQLRPVQIP
jgi:hypothetical protein